MAASLEPPRRSGARGLGWIAAAALLGIAACRLWLAVAMPLTDTTEARFAEMARKMVETADWLTPQHDYGIPYLAKPPLAMWLSAGGIELLGPGSIGPRLPVLALAAAFVAWFGAAAARELGRATAWASMLILSSSLMFFASAAAVMTDLVLTACVGTALLAFWQRYRGAGWPLELVAYAALGGSLLAKGPLGAVLIGAPIVSWAMIGGRLREISRRFAWRKGALLAACICVPWYALAEWRNPGFLRYFLVGEHLQRFLIPGWTGDLYGRAHDAPRGTIWLFFAIGLLPWSVIGLPFLLRAREAVARSWRTHSGFVQFHVIAAAVPLLLFTFSGNIIFPYALPAVPSAVLAAAALLSHRLERRAALVRVAAIALAASAALAAGAFAAAPLIERHSQREVLALLAASGWNGTMPIYYWQERHFSAEYYSGGQAKAVADPEALVHAARTEGRQYWVIPERRLHLVPGEIRARMQPIGTVGGQVVVTLNGAALAKDERLGGA